MDEDDSAAQPSYSTVSPTLEWRKTSDKVLATVKLPVLTRTVFRLETSEYFGGVLVTVPTNVITLFRLAGTGSEEVLREF